MEKGPREGTTVDVSMRLKSAMINSCCERGINEEVHVYAVNLAEMHHQGPASVTLFGRSLEDPALRTGKRPNRFRQGLVKGVVLSNWNAVFGVIGDRGGVEALCYATAPILEGRA